MITLLGADGTFSLHRALPNLVGGCCTVYFTHVALLFIATRKQDQMLARSILWHFKDNYLCWPCQVIAIRLLYASISSIVSLLGLSYLYYDTGTGKDNMGKMYCRTCITQLPLNNNRNSYKKLYQWLFPPGLCTKLFSLGTSPSLFLPTLHRRAHTHTLSSFLSILRVNSCFLTIM